jgi:Chalcone isomerase-like
MLKTPISMQRRCAWLIALAGLLSAGQGIAAPTTSKFDATAQVGGTSLQLNGKGTRTRFTFKAYDLALYTTARAKTPAEILALPGAKKLAFVALRDMSGSELGSRFLRGMKDNAAPEDMERHLVSTTRLIEIFSARPKMVSGETFAMEFIPGKGTTFFIQGQAQGAAVGNDDFFRLVLLIWFGEKPADEKLRNGLLDGIRD